MHIKLSKLPLYGQCLFHSIKRPCLDIQGNSTKVNQVEQAGCPIKLKGWGRSSSKGAEPSFLNDLERGP